MICWMLYYIYTTWHLKIPATSTAYWLSIYISSVESIALILLLEIVGECWTVDPFVYLSRQELWFSESRFPLNWTQQLNFLIDWRISSFSLPWLNLRTVSNAIQWCDTWQFSTCNLGTLGDFPPQFFDKSWKHPTESRHLDFYFHQALGLWLAQKSWRIMSRIYKESKKTSCLIRKLMRIIELYRLFKLWMTLRDAYYLSKLPIIKWYLKSQLLLLLQIDHECLMQCWVLNCWPIPLA